MKIAITSDIHYGITAEDEIRYLLFAHLQDENPDVIVIAGDIGESLVSPKLVSDCLNLFTSNFNCPIAAIAGNHDLWTNGQDRTSLEIWNEDFPKILKENNVHNLENNNLIIKDKAITGSYLHYNYGYKLLPYPDKYFKVNKIKHNSDAQFLKGLPDDVIFAQQIADKFKVRINEAQNNENVKDILVVTHVCPINSLVEIREEWGNVSVAYFSNNLSEKCILFSDKIRHVVCGHGHYWKKIEILKENRVITAQTIGSEYHHPAYVTVNL